MRKIYSMLLFLFLLVVPSRAQDNDNLIFRAMQDELVRNIKDLKLPESLPPFYISYALAETELTTVTATKGSILTSLYIPKERVNSVNLYIGDYNFSSDYSYSGAGLMSSMFAPLDDNYEQLRNAFWSNSDIAYKFAVEVYNSKKSNLKNANLSEEEKALPDMQKLEKSEISIESPVPFEFGQLKYEELASSLSREFSDDPALFDTRVELYGIQTTYFIVNSEGTKIKQPVNIMSMTLRAKVRMNNGSTFSDQFNYLTTTFNDLPSYEDLAEIVRDFSDNMVKIKQSEQIKEYYTGPVLFEETAVSAIFLSNLLNPSGLYSYRKPVPVNSTVARAEDVRGRLNIKPLEERMGKKVIDSRISVTNRTDMTSFKGVKLLGAYSIDAQGVIPPKELKLIDNGILKSLMSNRVPGKVIKESSGSVKLGVRQRSVVMGVAPGTLIIDSPGGSSPEDLKSALIKAAIEEGLDYGYIVRKFSQTGDQYLYRVSVNDGSETLVTGGEISGITLQKLKRVLGVSNEQRMENTMMGSVIPMSVIYPSALLLEDVEINVKRINIQKNSPLIKP
jgi:predicted Zn-dependent protease